MKLTANHLAKTIKGKTILSDICLTLESGVVYGFVGRNGSGKTMLFRALSELMKPDAGEVRYGEQVLHRDFSVLPGLGMVLENVGLYPELTGYKNLELLSRINKKIGEEEIREAIRRVGLDPADKRPYRKYSLGMKQRIVIAQAIMEKPEVLMLDEPTNSLDEGGVEEKRGAIVLLSSHNREDISLLADEVYQMEGGCLTARTVMEA